MTYDEFNEILNSLETPTLAAFTERFQELKEGKRQWVKEDQ